MKLHINSEFLKRHLFVTVLMFGMSCWFGYDGLIKYPQTPAAELYRQIENADAPAGYDLDAFKRQKTQTQYGFTVLSLLAALAVGLHLLKVAKFDFAFDDDGFTAAGRKFGWDALCGVDRSRWTSKTILVITVKGGPTLTLDAWHHVGVKDFEAKLRALGR